MFYLFQLRLAQIRNGLGLILRKGRLRLFIGIFVLLVVWAGIFAGFYRAFIFLQTFMGVGEILIDRLIYLLTFALFIMLIFSNAVISFQLHLKGAETAYLHTLPLPHSTVFRFLVLEGAVLSTWATLFLIFPVVCAYGLTHRLTFFAYLSLILFSVLLAGLAALLGTLIAALIPRLLISRKVQLAALAVIAIVIISVPLFPKLSPTDRATTGRQSLMINKLLEHSRITLNPAFPGYWAADGFIQAARGRYARSLGFLAVLGVNVLFIGQIVELTAEKAYSRTWSLYHSRKPSRKEKINPRRKDPLEAIFFCLPSSVRALLVKDVKIFLRDPAQWLQTAILFGLLAIYIVNIRNMPRNVYQTFWKNLITVFNLGATSLILATLTTRFIYPSFSLEGRTFWILGLAPIPRERIFKVKFWSCFIGAIMVTVPLMLLSNRILEVSGTMTLITCGAIIIMAGVLVSLATGMGAIFPDFSQDNPSRIASGFGGTLNLVISLIYIAIMVGTLAAAYQLRGRFPAGGQTPFLLVVSGFGLIISFLGVYLPFKLGLRALKKCEF